MPPTAQYHLIHGNTQQAAAALVAHVAEGWKPIFMSTAVTPNEVHVYIMMEKPLGS